MFYLPARRFTRRVGGFSFFTQQKVKDLPNATFRKRLDQQPTVHSSSRYDPQKSSKKKIVIFSSTGGGGHTAVAKGLCDYLADTYDITVLNALQSVLAPIDTLRTLTFGKVSGEDIYNLCLRCGWTNFAGKYQKAGTSYMTWRHKALVSLLCDYFSQTKPDLIISVIPMVNGAFHEASKRLGIPFIVITNDLDSTGYVHELKPPFTKRFRYCIPFDDPEIRKKFAHAGIPKNQIIVSGFPLRPEFFTPKKVGKLKRKFNVPEGKPVVMVFMGGAGSQSSYRYVRRLARLNKPIHLIVCLGKNERLKRNISKIMLPKGVTISLIGFTDKIAQLMAISDVLITKPGPNSVCEGLQSCVPMILDQTFGTIWWEQLNIDFMVKHGFAESLIDVADLETILPKYFVDSSFTDTVKHKMRSFKCKRFDTTIKRLVADMTDSQKRSVK